MRKITRLLTVLACGATVLAQRPAMASPMHCVIAGGDQAAGSATLGIGRFEGDIDASTLTEPTPAQWTLGGNFGLFHDLRAHAVQQGRFVLIDVKMGDNPYLELVVDQLSARAWIRGYIYPDGRVWVREWAATCDPSPPDGLPPPPPSVVAAGSPAPTTGPLIPRHSKASPPARLWLIDRRAPAEIAR